MSLGSVPEALFRLTVPWSDFWSCERPDRGTSQRAPMPQPDDEGRT